MNIIVTGGAGFIGSHVAEAYLAMGHRVIIIDNLYSGYKENVPAGAEFYEMSIGDPRVENIFKENSIDILNHHAAQIDVRKSVADPIFDANTNIIDSVKLLGYCKKYGVKKVIYSSTGGAIYGEPRYLPADEKHPIRPLAPYGISKYSFEKYIEYHHDLFGLDYTIFRYANVYGPRQDPLGEAGVVAIFSGLMLEDKDCLIFGDGSQTRDYVCVKDVAQANILALSAGSGEIINIGTGVQTSVLELYQAMCKVMGIDRPPIHKPERPGEVSHIALDARHAEEVLNWKAEYDFSRGLKLTIDFFRNKTVKV